MSNQKTNPIDERRDALAHKIKGWVAGISAEILDADPDAAALLQEARATLEKVYQYERAQAERTQSRGTR